ncbi:hypothetical protein CEUSTIGMA_g733.t1 [Chlamydomonas eustigma]|uniref:Uncharacterized protein n=1 Tax=Chlamydomonas eustigma TaxID=1157962 RepID=A0A250WRF7_9CHLO|nr:hypothetical protein CEUSTIGMA_g733.t1 [Chlamydomonas eustigma]|eukprot:GAX73279.1 hypothetical protein CEUSTIGMA_g733.t1 [Chlamydomonas eustigma]
MSGKSYVKTGKSTQPNSTPQSSRQGVLLLPDDDDEVASQSGSKEEDPKVVAGIQKYLQKQESARKQEPVTRVVGAVVVDDQEDEHTGITDDEDGIPEDEDDYDVISRQSLKASSEAFYEVLSEVHGMKLSDKEAMCQKGSHSLKSGTSNAVNRPGLK